MAKIILLNKVQIDGWGDFQHFLDIYHAMNTHERMKNNKYISFLCAPLRAKELEEKINHYNNSQHSENTKLQDFYIVPHNDTNFHEKKEVQQHFAECEQILIISFYNFPNTDEFLTHCKPNVIVKYIGEHEREEVFTSDITKITTTSGEKIQNPIASYSMGLSKSKNIYGIKLDIPTNDSDPWEIIRKNDPQFFENLLTLTKSTNIEHFVEANFFMPCYFNNIFPFLRFLLLLAINDSLPEKNIVLSFSGAAKPMCRNIEDIFTGKNPDLKFFKTSHVKEIRLIGNDSQSYPVNPQGTKIIYIVHSFYVSNESYRAIYKTKPLLAAVSGDNTLELTIANKILPFYVSTNFKNKKDTNIALFENAKKLSRGDKNDLLIFLNFEKFQKFVQHLYNDELIEEFKRLDLIVMSQQWQEVAAHIIKNYNFYDKLEAIFNDKVSNIEATKHTHAIQMWNQPRIQPENNSNNNNNNNNNNNSNNTKDSSDGNNAKQAYSVR